MLEDAQLMDQDFEEGGNRTWATQVTIDGLIYATSLFWQPLQNTDDPVTEVNDAAEGQSAMRGDGISLFRSRQHSDKFIVSVNHERVIFETVVMVLHVIAIE